MTVGQDVDSGVTGPLWLSLDIQGSGQVKKRESGEFKGVSFLFFLFLKMGGSLYDHGSNP